MLLWWGGHPRAWLCYSKNNSRVGCLTTETCRMNAEKLLGLTPTPCATLSEEDEDLKPIIKVFMIGILDVFQKQNSFFFF
jgi:hypothetical protein